MIEQVCRLCGKYSDLAALGEFQGALQKSEAQKLNEEATVYINKIEGFVSQIESMAVLQDSLSPQLLHTMNHGAKIIKSLKGFMEIYDKDRIYYDRFGNVIH